MTELATKSNPARSRFRTLERAGEYLLGRHAMLIGIFFVIVILWLLGVMLAYTLGGLIHLLLLLAAIVLFIEFLERRKVF